MVAQQIVKMQSLTNGRKLFLHFLQIVEFTGLPNASNKVILIVEIIL